MTNDTERTDKLPVTAELGDEGGSYGDATTQADTFGGATGHPRVDPKRVAPTGAEAAIPPEGGSPRDSGDEVKHATDAPDAPPR